MLNKNHTIGIAGMVGIGKSTLAKKLSDKLDINLSLESVDDNPYLEKYYDDFSRWGFHLQIYFLVSRFKEQKKMFEYGKGFIQDRTIFEDLEIFAKLNYDNESMSEEDYLTYKNLFESMVLTPFFQKPDIVIYLEGEFDDILDRMQKRSRNMEVNTEKKYWEDLFMRYEKWIESYSHTPLLRININDYDVEDENSIDEIVNKIEKIISLKNS